MITTITTRPGGLDYSKSISLPDSNVILPFYSPNGGVCII